MRSILFAIIFLSTTYVAPVSAQELDVRALHLAAKILEKIPDIPVTARSLGRGDERPARALVHAHAIVAAGDAYQEQWVDIARRGNWQHFNPHTDLPALIAAIASKESSFNPVVRMDSGAHVYGNINAVVAAGRSEGNTSRLPRADIGVMQVRAPSGSARRCGVETREDLNRLISDLPFAYTVGACVLTNHVSHYIDSYTQDNFTRLHNGQRPSRELRFYGLWGARRGTPEAAKARELLVLERYNWGGRNLYDHTRGAGYARRIIQEFEFFSQEPVNSEMHWM